MVLDGEMIQEVEMTSVEQVVAMEAEAATVEIEVVEVAEEDLEALEEDKAGVIAIEEEVQDVDIEVVATKIATVILLEMIIGVVIRVMHGDLDQALQVATTTLEVLFKSILEEQAKVDVEFSVELLQKAKRVLTLRRNLSQAKTIPQALEDVVWDKEKVMEKVLLM